MRRRVIAMAAALFLAGGLLGGCAVVRPWQRGVLMKRAMKPAPASGGTTFELHVHTIREAMAGAAGDAGASCGCN